MIEVQFFFLFSLFLFEVHAYIWLVNSSKNNRSEAQMNFKINLRYHVPETIYIE